MIEWMPIDDDGWVIASAEEDEEVSSFRSSESFESRREFNNRLKFSVDIKDLRSFQCVEPKKGISFYIFASEKCLHLNSIFK